MSRACVCALVGEFELHVAVDLSLELDLELEIEVHVEFDGLVLLFLLGGRLGLGLQALIGVTLRGGARQANITDFAESVRDLPGVLQVFFLGGTDDFMIHIAVADTAALRSFVVDHLSSRPGVAATRTSVVFDYHRNGVAASFQ